MMLIPGKIEGQVEKWVAEDMMVGWHHQLNGYVKVTQSCLTLFDPIDYSVHGILQARILERVDLPFSRRYSQPRDGAQVSRFGQILYQLSHKGSPRILERVAYAFSRRSSQPRNRTWVNCR